MIDSARFSIPKILGAWNLHEATRDLPLEHFICFSSFSSLVGGVKQSNYNSGNYFLDRQRRAPKDVDTSTVVTAIQDGNVTRATIVDREQRNRSTGTLTDGTKIRSEYVDGQGLKLQEMLQERSERTCSVG